MFFFALGGEFFLLFETVFLPPAWPILCLGLIALGEAFGFRLALEHADETDLPDSGESTS